MTQFRQYSLVAFACFMLPAAFTTVLSAEEEQAIVPEPADLGRPVEFQRDIYPILAGSCLACHSKTKAESDLILESAELAIKGGSSGEVIVPGEPDESYLYMVASRSEEPFMPPAPNQVEAKPLTPKQLGLLRQWIIEGAKGDASTGSDSIEWLPVPDALTAVYSIDADPFGRFVAAGRANKVVVYDLAAPGATRSLTDPALESPGASHRDYAHAVAFNPAGDLVASAGYRVIKLWKRADTAVAGQHDLPALDMNVSADGALLVKISETGAAQLFQAAEDKMIADLNKDLSSQRLIFQRESDRAMREARVNVVKSQLEQNQKRHDEQNKALEAANEKHKKATEAVPEAEKKLTEAHAAVTGPDKQLAEARAAVTESEKRLTEAQAAVTEAEKQLTEAPENEELTKTVDELRKNAEQLKKNVDELRQNVVEQKKQILAESKTTVTEVEKQLVDTPDNEELKKKLDELRNHVEELMKNRLPELQAAITTAEKQLTEAPENEELKKEIEELKKSVEEQTKKEAELQKAVVDTEKGVVDAKKAVKSAARGIELAKQSVARAEERLQARKDLLALSETELQQSTVGRDEATAVVVEMKLLTAVFIPNEPLLATIEASGTVRVWSSVDGTPIDVVPIGRPIEGSLKSVASNGRLLSIVDAADNTTTVDLFPEWELLRELGPQEGSTSVFADRVLSLAFSPDGSRLAAGGGEASRSGELTIWKTSDWTLEREIKDAHSDTVYGLDFSADGRFLASGAADKFLKVFNIETGEHVRSYEGHTHHVMDVSWKGDRTSLVSAGADNVLKVWDAETGEQRRTISTHKKQVTSVEYVGLQDNFLSSSGDKRVTLHQAGDGKTVREFAGSGDYVYCSSITQNGKLVVAGGEDGVVRVWNGADAKSISTFDP